MSRPRRCTPVASIQLGVPADGIETCNLHAGAKPGPAPAHDMKHLAGCLPAEDAGAGRTRRRWMDTQFALPAARTACRRQPDHRRGRDRRRPISRRSASHLQHRRRVQPKRQGSPPGAAGGVGRAAHRAHAGPRGQRIHPLPGRNRRHRRRFADEVVPAIRNAVRTERGRQGMSAYADRGMDRLRPRQPSRNRGIR